MKFNFLKILILMLAVGLFSCSKNLDDVVKANIDARGGEAVRNIKTINVQAKLISMGFTTSYRMYLESPDKLRYELNLMGKDIYTIMNGNKGWLISDTTLQDIPEMNLKEMKEEMKYQFNIFKSQLANYKEDNLKTELLGKVKDSSLKKDVYKIHMILKDSTDITDFIDADTYLEYKTITKRKNGPNASEHETYYKDYKKVNGFTIPHKIEIKMKGSVVSGFTFEKVSINEPIKPEMFQPFNPKGMAVK
jgi:outer membrane lipoprotein-sorting protein